MKALMDEAAGRLETADVTDAVMQQLELGIE
jgi:hypothetical protein